MSKSRAGPVQYRPRASNRATREEMMRARNHFARSAPRPIVEALERRLVLSGSGAIVAAATDLAQDTVTLAPGAESITLKQDANHQQIDWTAGGQSGAVAINDPAGLTIFGDNAIDTLTFDASAGNPLPNLLNLDGTFAVNGLPTIGQGQTIDIGASAVAINYQGATPLSTIQQYISG